MKRKIISILLCLVLLTVTMVVQLSVSADGDVWDGTASASLAGSGTQTDPYLISSGADLKFFANSVNSGNDYATKYIMLTEDIDLNNLSFDPIGNTDTYFRGYFDGDNHTIKNLKIVSASSKGIALFGACHNARLSNLTVKGYIKAVEKIVAVSGIAAIVNGGSMENCAFDGTVYSSNNLIPDDMGGWQENSMNFLSACGLVSNVMYDYTIDRCSVSGTIDGFGRSGGLIGAVTGEITVNITNSYCDATVTGRGPVDASLSNYYTAGGLVGMQQAGVIILKNCFFAGTAPTPRSTGFAGPIINHDHAGVFSCTNVFYVGDKQAEPDGHEYGTFKTAAEFADGTVLSILNEEEEIFVQGAAHPVLKLAEGEEVFTLWDGSVSDSLAGSGTQDDPYLISSGADLKFFANSVNSGNDYATKYIKLTENLDLNNLSFDPIGSTDAYFRGYFDGDNHTIKNLKIVSASSKGIALFGACHNARLSNLTVKGYIKAVEKIVAVSGIAAIVNGGSMENCAFDGTVYSSNNLIPDDMGGWQENSMNFLSACGLVSNVMYDYTIDRCSVSGTIDGFGRSGGLIGAVTGEITVNITNSYCDATVTGRGPVDASLSNYYTAGGLVGMQQAGVIILKNCFFAGTAPTPRSTGFAGPIINHDHAGVFSCTNVFYVGDKQAEPDGHEYGTFKTAAEFADGTVLAILNEEEEIFVQGETHPVLQLKTGGDVVVKDRYIRRYTFDNHPADLAAYKSNPDKYMNDGYIEDSFGAGGRLYNYGRYNNNEIFVPQAEYANGEGYGVAYTAYLGSTFAFIDPADIKADRFYKFSVDAKVIDVEPEVTVKIGLFRPAVDYGALSFMDAEGNTYDTAIKTVSLTLDKLTDYETYTVEISGQEIIAFCSGYDYTETRLYFGPFCPDHVLDGKYKDVVGMAVDNFIAFETEIPADYVPSADLPAVDILDEKITQTYGEHLYNIIENCSFEDELTGALAGLPAGFTVKTAGKSDVMFGNKYLSGSAADKAVRIAIPFSLTINQSYTFGISTRTSADAEYRVFFSASAEGAPLTDVDFAEQKFLISKNSEKGEIVRSGIYFRNTMKNNTTQYLVLEVKKGTVDFDEITLTGKTVTEENKNYYESTEDVTVTVYDLKTLTETKVAVPKGKTVYDVVK